MKVVVLTLLVLIRPAAADNPIHLYGEASAYLGAVGGENQYPNGYVEDADTTVLDGRFAIGGRVGTGTVQMRLGAVVDLFKAIGGYGEGAAVGVESEADIELVENWRLGLRLSGSLGDAGGAPAGGDGQVVMAGLRVRNPIGSFGIDGMFVRRGENGERGFVNGVLVGGGIDGRAGKYAVATAGGLAAIALTIVVIAFSTGPVGAH